MPQRSELEAEKKRRKVQAYFWSIVGSSEHINLPKLEDALRKEFHNSDDRLIQMQIELMQTEAKIRIERKNKVWIRQPSDA